MIQGNRTFSGSTRPRYAGRALSRRVLTQLWVTFVLVFLCFFSAAGVLPAQAAPPPPGTIIDSQATLSYFNPTLGRYETVSSNVVRAIVQPVEDFTLVADQQVQATPGSPVSFVHTLTNTGNTSFACLLDSAPLAGGDFVLAGVTVVHDLNDNGLPTAEKRSFLPADRSALPPVNRSAWW